MDYTIETILNYSESKGFFIAGFEIFKWDNDKDLPAKKSIKKIFGVDKKVAMDYIKAIS